MRTFQPITPAATVIDRFITELGHPKIVAITFWPWSYGHLERVMVHTAGPVPGYERGTIVDREDVLIRLTWAEK